MKRHLNTLFVMTEGCYLAMEGEAVVVREGKDTKLRVPIHTIEGIVCFGRVSCSPYLLGLCGERGVAVSFFTPNGRFLACVRGFSPGNVLLRRQQYRWADRPTDCLNVARPIVVAKLANSRVALLRAMRDHRPSDELLKSATERIRRCVGDAQSAPNLDVLRGAEGEGARSYFGAFSRMITHRDSAFHFRGRNRRPPKDAVNAMLSFLYAILAHDLRGAIEASGLDAAVGFLHRDRPGRPGLALDLMEEFRTFIADRVVLTLINRQQVHSSGFLVQPGGGVQMDDDTRKVLLAAYQERKQEEITHPFLGERTTVGLLLHLQARLLARFLRGDLDGYPAFLSK